MQYIVIDTNVFVSGIFYGGTPRNVLDCVADGRVIPCFTEATYHELERVLTSEKFMLERNALWFDVRRYLNWITSVSAISPRLFVAEIIKEDLADNEILACALSARASFIVSGDNHLLVLKSFGGIPIVTPKEFIDIIGA